MIRFTCPNCDKGLRADDSKAGSLVQCPSCEHKLTIPATETEPPFPEEEEPQQPAPRKKKKRSRGHPKSSQASQGKVLVLIICGVVLGMHLISVVRYLTIPDAPDPVEMAKKQTQEMYQKLGKDLPKDFEEKLEKELDKVMSSKEMQADLRRSHLTGLVWILVGFGLSAVLLIFLYLQHDWARIVLAALLLIGAGLGVLGLVFGALAGLKYLGTGAAILSILEILVRLGVNISIGVALLKSESIMAYTVVR
jgi:DNA-directed RNA polymerase subunit RPC12/RpoP